MLKYLSYICICISFSFLLLGKSYSSEQIFAANFLAKNNIIRDWSRIPTRYRFNDYIRLVDALNIGLVFHDIPKNTQCRGDFVDLLSPYSNEWCYTFETATDNGIFDSHGKKISPLQSITHREFMDIFMGNKEYKLPAFSSQSQRIKRGEAFILLYDLYTRDK